MRWPLPLVALVALVAALVAACKSSDSTPSPPAANTAPANTAAANTAPTNTAPANTAAPTQAAPKPPDEMDERMRHCPLALDGATSTVEDIEGGVRFTIKVQDAQVDNVRRRAHHIVDFAAKRTREGHGSFDGKGGGRMKNCPVLTDGVTITATDIDGGAQLDVLATGDVASVRTETRERVKKFPFTGATVTVKP